MWWITAAIAQEAPQEHLFAWHRDEEGRRIESIWIRPDGDVHRADGFVTVVDGEVLRWASLPYTRFAEECSCDERERGAYCLELEEVQRQVLVRFDPNGWWTEEEVGRGTVVYPVGQLGPSLFLEEWHDIGDCYRPRSELRWPIYDLQKGTAKPGEATLAFVPDSAVGRARERAITLFQTDWSFLCGAECPEEGPPEPEVFAPGEPEARRLIPSWDARGSLVTEVVFEAGYGPWPNDVTGSRSFVHSVPIEAPPELAAWGAPPAPVAPFLADRSQGGWSRAAVTEQTEKALRAIFDVPPPVSGAAPP